MAEIYICFLADTEQEKLTLIKLKALNKIINFCLYYEKISTESVMHDCNLS